MERIDDFVRRYWPQLMRGEKIEVPAAWIEHPASRPDLFGVPPGAWPVGQTCDYVWRLREGGRIHAQCFGRNGSPMLRVHLDRFDPDRSFGDLLLHAIHETPVGPILGAAAAIGAVALIIGGVAAAIDSIES